MGDILFIIVLTTLIFASIVLIYMAARRDSSTQNSTGHKNESELKVLRRMSDIKKSTKESDGDNSEV